jgi:hypothetical protein
MPANRRYYAPFTGECEFREKANWMFQVSVLVAMVPHPRRVRAVKW